MSQVPQAPALSRLRQQLDFIVEIDKLKYILRKTRLFGSQRHENDAEHSWHLCMMAMVLQEYTPATVDVLKVMKMLLIHDLVEIDAGDTFLYDPARAAQHSVAEAAAAERIFGLLPAEQGEEMKALWQEFETGDSAEVLFARALDRLEPVLQNLSNGGGTWAEHQIPLATILQKIQGIQRGTPVLWDEIIDRMQQGIADGSVVVGVENPTTTA